MDYGPYVDIDDAPQATDNVEKNQNGMTFRVYLNGELAAPRAGQEVVWVRCDTATGAELANGREFAGVITTVAEIDLGATLTYDVQAQSYQRWFDKRLVNGFFQQQLAETTIKEVIARYCPLFTYNNVSAPFTVIAQYAEYRRPSDFVKQLVDQVGYGWYIDHYRDVHTYRTEDFPSPLPSNILDVDNDYTNYGDLELTEDAENVFNRFTVRGYKLRSKTPYTLRFKGDGTTNQWQLGYRFSSAKGDTVVTIDSVDYPIVRDILDGIPGQVNDPSKAFVHWTQHTLRFANPPASGAIIEFTGYPLISKTRVDQDDASVEYMSQIEAPADGIYEWAELDRSLTQSTQDAITSKLQLMALKYGFPTLSGAFTSFTQGWKAGQFFRMSSTRRMGGLDPNDRFYIYRVTKKWIQAQQGGLAKVEYRVEFADKPYLI